MCRGKVACLPATNVGVVSSDEFYPQCDMHAYSDSLVSTKTFVEDQNDHLQLPN